MIAISEPASASADSPATAPRLVAQPIAADRSQSLERGLDALELLDSQAGTLGVRDMARRLGLGPAIVQRLLNTLAARGYVEQDPETRRYRIGPRAIGLGAGAPQDGALMRGAREALERLAAGHGLNGFLGAVRDGRLIYLLAVQSPGPIAIRATLGSTTHFHTTAMGKALLAAMPAEAAAALLGTGALAAATPRSITDRAALRDDLLRAARRGWAAVDGENIPGVVSAGVALRDGSGQALAALSVAAPGEGAGALAAVAAPLLAEARALAQRLGCPAALLPPAAP